MQFGLRMRRTATRAASASRTRSAPWLEGGPARSLAGRKPRRCHESGNPTSHRSWSTAPRPFRRRGEKRPYSTGFTVQVRPELLSGIDRNRSAGWAAIRTCGGNRWRVSRTPPCQSSSSACTLCSGPWLTSGSSTAPAVEPPVNRVGPSNPPRTTCTVPLATPAQGVVDDDEVR